VGDDVGERLLGVIAMPDRLARPEPLLGRERMFEGLQPVQMLADGALRRGVVGARPGLRLLHLIEVPDPEGDQIHQVGRRIT
jgi:hypothetical protein